MAVLIDSCELASGIPLLGSLKLLKALGAVLDLPAERPTSASFRVPLRKLQIVLCVAHGSRVTPEARTGPPAPNWNQSVFLHGRYSGCHVSPLARRSSKCCSIHSWPWQVR